MTGELVGSVPPGGGPINVRDDTGRLVGTVIAEIEGWRWRHYNSRRTGVVKEYGDALAALMVEDTRFDGVKRKREEDRQARLKRDAAARAQRVRAIRLLGDPIGMVGTVVSADGTPRPGWLHFASGATGFATTTTLANVMLRDFHRDWRGRPS